MIFVDTSFWFAWLVANDVNHPAAGGLMERYGKDRPLVTSDRVCEETWTLLRRRRGYGAASSFIGALRSQETAVSTRTITPVLANTAWAWLLKHNEREYSFVDASSFVLMADLGLTDAFTFDGDFSAAGLVELK